MRVLVEPIGEGRHAVRVEYATTVGGQAVQYTTRESTRDGPASRSEWLIHHRDHPNRRLTWYVRRIEGAAEVQREDHVSWSCGCVSRWACHRSRRGLVGYATVFGVGPLHAIGAGRYGVREWCEVHGTQRVDALRDFARPASSSGPAYRRALAAATRRLGAAGARAATYAALSPVTRF